MVLKGSIRGLNSGLIGITREDGVQVCTMEHDGVGIAGREF